MLPATRFRGLRRHGPRLLWDLPHHLPRQDMTNRCTLFGLRLKRDDRYEPLMRLAPARAAPTGRAFR